MGAKMKKIVVFFCEVGGGGPKKFSELPFLAGGGIKMTILLFWAMAWGAVEGCGGPLHGDSAVTKPQLNQPPWRQGNQK